MYKCLDCGNTAKFIGKASEKGEAIIEKDYNGFKENSQYSWIYIVSDKSWQTDFTVEKCFYCKSKNIKNI